LIGTLSFCNPFILWISVTVTTMLVSLDNSTRCTGADFRKRKKCHVWDQVCKGGLLQRSGAGFPLRCSSPALRGAYPLRRDSASDKIRVIHPSVKGLFYEHSHLCPCQFRNPS
jgi:hypothetical protein